MHRPIATLALLAVAWLGVAPELSAQGAGQLPGAEQLSETPSSQEPAGPDGEAEPHEEGGWWAGILGERTPDRLYAGLWTLHLKRKEDGLSQHHLVALGWRGMYVGTFMNSHGNRTWALALARSAVAMEGRDAGFSLGYRIGLLTGYDEQLARVAGSWPAIPAAELVGTLRYGRVGIQGQFAGIVTSFGLFITL